MQSFDDPNEYYEALCNMPNSSAFQRNFGMEHCVYEIDNWKLYEFSDLDWYIKAVDDVVKIYITMHNPSRTTGTFQISIEEGKRFVVGLDKCANIWVHDIAVSRLHCELFVEEGQLFVVDTYSTTGTFVNNSMISSKHPIRLHDEIRLGSVTLVFHY